MPTPSQQSSTSHGHVSQASRGLFPQAPTFDLETFSNRDFIVKDFVEALSDSAVPPLRKSASANQSNVFDPKPLIRSFETALTRMSDLSGDLELRENELSNAVRRAEAQYTNNVQTLGHKLDQTVESFNRLDSSLSSDDYDSTGIHVVKIGDRLEELDRQRQRALDAKQLVQCWLEVSARGEMYILEDMRRSGKGEGKVKCAHIARQLLKISQRLDAGNWGGANGSRAVNGVNGVSKKERKQKHNTRELIEKFLETLEKDLLRSFDDCFRRMNYGGMRECAKALHDFSDGASVIAAFVNQHDFFIARSQTEEIGGDAETWERLADPDADPPGVEPSLQLLIDEVRNVVQDEAGVIRKAFPYAEQVLKSFIQRIFQQSIQQRLELVLEKAGSISSLAFLRSLQGARSCISALIDDLKAHGLTEHPESVSPQISIILDQQFDDLFVPYFVGSSYIERERRSLEELYSSLLFKFTIYHSRRRKSPTTFMKSLAKSGHELLSSARDHYAERLESSDLAPAQKRMLRRVANLKDTDNARAETEIEVTEADGNLSISNTKRMLKWLAEAVGRGLELSGGTETPKDVSLLLNLLLTNMGQIYLETALDSADDSAVSQETSKTEPDLSYLLTLRPAISTMYLLSTSVRTVLIPLSAANITIRRDMEKTGSAALNRLEDKVNSILQRTIDVVMTWTSKLLAQQKKTDFRPRDDAPGSWLEQLQTPTCASIFTFLTKFHNMALTSLSPSPNLVALMTETATGLRGQLLEHFRKFNVNAAGGIMVTKDVSKYIELMRSWELEEDWTSTSFEVLTEIGNLFVIGPEALKERLRVRKGGLGGRAAGGIGPGRVGTGLSRVGTGSLEGGQGGSGPIANSGQLWDASDLRAYVLRREDVGSVGVQAALSAV